MVAGFRHKLLTNPVSMQMSVTTLNGDVLPVYDGHGVWYNFSDGQWYYHSISSNIPVDINSVVVTPNNP